VRSSVYTLLKSNKCPVFSIRAPEGHFRERKRLRGFHPYMIRMLQVHRDICGYCGCCVAVCPEGALELIDAYLEVEDWCTSCGICAKVCPLGALEVINER
jgi:ferredoxin